MINCAAMDLGQLQNEISRRRQAVAKGQSPQVRTSTRATDDWFLLIVRGRPPTYDQASFKHVFPFDILSFIIGHCSGDRKALLALALTSKDCSHEATKLLWAFYMRISASNIERMMRLSSFIASKPKKALYIRQIHVYVPGRIAPSSFVRRGRALRALCDVLSCTHDLESLCIEVDEFFHETATALSTAAEMGRLVFRLKALETNLFAADGFAGFLQTQPNMEKLTQHWRRDRFLNEPGTLSGTTLSANPNADTGASAGGDGAIGDGISALPPSSYTLASGGVPLLPNLRRLQHAPRGMAEVA